MLGAGVRPRPVGLLQLGDESRVRAPASAGASPAGTDHPVLRFTFDPKRAEIELLGGERQPDFR
jgi:hypothetical protein